MIAIRMLRLGLHLAIGLWTCALVFPWVSRAGRGRRVQRWSRQLLSLCGIEVETCGNVPHPHALGIANHLSWLDIFVINAILPSRFVAKAEIRSWPLIGWLCAKSGTVFISRGSRRDVRRIFEGLVNSLKQGEALAFFPEGTTALQGELLPFHANLFEAAIDAKVPVQPYALRYLRADGSFHPSIEFVGETSFAESMMRILRGGPVRASLQVLPPISSDGALRRELAEASRQAVAAALALPAPAGQLTPAFDTAGSPPAAACGLPGAPR